MKIGTYLNRPTTRVEFERHLFLLREAVREGRMRFSHPSQVEGMTRVRSLPNHRIDMLSVDEATRLKANMIASSLFDAPEIAPTDSKERRAADEGDVDVESESNQT